MTIGSTHPPRPPRGFLFDYGGTLVEEAAFDARAGMDALLAAAAHRPAHATRDAIMERVDRVSRDVSERRDQFQIETPWISLTRLIYDYFGVQFGQPLAELELAFWNASVTTHPMPGAADALRELSRRGIPMGVVSNSSFSKHVIKHELAKHGLSQYLSAVVVSAEYGVRKPNPLLFEAAAALLGVGARDVWFVGDRLDTDMAGARAAGMVPIWYGPNENASREGELLVRAWRDLARVVSEP
jgi:putative hydrolase of the HAD superfamily